MCTTIIEYLRIIKCFGWVDFGTVHWVRDNLVINENQDIVAKLWYCFCMSGSNNCFQMIFVSLLWQKCFPWSWLWLFIICRLVLTYGNDMIVAYQGQTDTRQELIITCTLQTGLELWLKNWTHQIDTGSITYCSIYTYVWISQIV